MLNARGENIPDAGSDAGTDASGNTLPVTVPPMYPTNPPPYTGTAPVTEPATAHTGSGLSIGATDIGGYFVRAPRIFDPIVQNQPSPDNGNAPSGVGAPNGAPPANTGGGNGPPPSQPSTPVIPLPTGATPNEGDNGADAGALNKLLDLFQGAFGNGGQGAGAGGAGTLISSAPSGGVPSDPNATGASAGASLNLTTIVLAAIVLGAAYLVYRHFKNKGATAKSLVSSEKK